MEGGRQVFISHASEDARIAEVLCAYLEAAGIACWIAPRDVTPGREYAAEILDGIESASAFVLLLSAQANRSPFVRRELERAASKDKRLFLVRVEEVAPDRSLELFVSSEHWVDAWAEPRAPQWARLASAIKGERAASAAPPAGRGGSSLKSLAAAVGVGVLATVAVVAGWSLFRGERDAPVVEAGGPPPVVPDSALVAAPARPLVETPPATAAALDPCPPYYAINPDLPSPFACRCEPGASYQGAVWGTDVYTADSGLCQAAVHAGVISRDGGRVVVERAPGRELYAGTRRNGVVSGDYGPYHPAIHFAGTPQAAEPAPCPARLSINPNLPTPYTCVCSSEAMHAGAVWGTDVYTADSQLCGAALHAGKLGEGGGPVTVLLADGRALYAGSSRNGLVSHDYGRYSPSIRFP